MACSMKQAGGICLFRWLVAWLLALAMPLSLAQSLIRTAAQEASEPKFIALTQDGKPSIGGICIDIMQAIENIEPGIRFTGQQNWLPMARMQAAQVDAICGILQTKERSLKYDFVDIPLFTVSYMLAVRSDDTVQVNDWNDIRKLGNEGIILSMRNFAISDMLKSIDGLQIDDTAVSSKSNLNKLLAHRGRFYCHRSPGIVAEIHKAGLQDKIKLLPKIMLRQPLYMALSKNLPSADARKIRTAIAQLDNQGVLAKLFEKYQE